MNRNVIDGYLEKLYLQNPFPIVEIGENAKIGTLFIYDTAQVAVINLAKGAVVGSIASEVDTKITGDGDVLGIAIKKGKKLIIEENVVVSFQVENEAPILKD